jgi:hypothetical protein
MYMQPSVKMKKIWDKLGIVVSATCAVHCLVVGMLPFALPLLDSFFHSPLFHILFVVMVVVITPMAFGHHFQRHGFSYVINLALAGVAGIIMGAALEPVSSELVSHGVSMFGSFFLVFAHVLNLRHQRKHKHC